MYYEDQARRFNLLSGFVCGALVGTGLGLLAGPLDLRLPRRRRSRRKRLQKRWSELSGGAGRVLQTRLGRRRRGWRW
jgi:hypothetical protein